MSTLYVIITQIKDKDNKDWTNAGSPYTRKTMEGVEEVVKTLKKFDPTCGGLIGTGEGQRRLSIRKTEVVSETFVDLTPERYENSGMRVRKAIAKSLEKAK